MIDNSKEYILCSAIRRKETKRGEKCRPYHEGKNDICEIEIGYRHHDIYQRFHSELRHEEGFYTSRGRFVNRYEAMEIAYLAGQVSQETACGKNGYKRLFSEDLY